MQKFNGKENLIQTKNSNMAKYSTIVGVGIARLSVGVCARQSGFNTAIIESHSISRRKLYRLAAKRVLV
jgi:hypothetical protein